MFFFFFKQKTAYEMRISDWSSDVCSSDLIGGIDHPARKRGKGLRVGERAGTGQHDAEQDEIQPLHDALASGAISRMIPEAPASMPSDTVPLRKAGRMSSLMMSAASSSVSAFSRPEPTSTRKTGSASCRERWSQTGERQGVPLP